MPYRREVFRAGEYYHIYNRGNNRQPIFFERENYLFFLRLLRKHLIESMTAAASSAAHSGLIVIAYCLMPNHYHLLTCLKTDLLADLMQPFSLSYTKAINKRYGRTGSLFQSPFKAIRIDRNEYLLHLSRYIHWNPVAAKLVKQPEDWEFSSYREYIRLREGTLPQADIILEQFGSPLDYRAFVETYQESQQQMIEHLILED